MSEIYGDKHRHFQDQFETRKMADRMEEMIIKDSLDEMDKMFVASRDMFFLSTVDHQGRPTVSYKGGDVGFVTIVDDRTIAFPSYDGNGMFFSMGNIAENSNIGILFIDFENPNRMRLQGSASIQDNDPLLANYKEADLIVRVAIQQTWVNCPRYIHRYKKLDPSRYVPRTDCDTPLATWKRIDEVQDVLPPKDLGRPEKEGGLITMEEYGEKVMKGET